MNRIFTFHGADHKCGTSMIAQCTFERLAEKLPGTKLLLLHAENSFGLEYSPQAEENIEHIKPYIPDKLIDISELLQKSHYKGNLYIIGGADKLGSANEYTPGMCESLLAQLLSAFDLIICSSGCHIEHGLSLGALLCADSALLVTNQSENSLRRFERRSNFYGRLEISFDNLIVNAYQKSYINTPELIATRMGFTKEQVLCIKRSPHSEEAEHDGVSLLSFRDRAFTKEIDNIANFIMHQRD